MKQFLDTALEAAAAASIPILARYHGSFEVEIKADATPVTIADREAEQAIRKVLGAAFPGHGIYGEEYGKDQFEAEYLWLVDPIDGTKSFVRGTGMFSTQIALMHRGELVLGVSSAPAAGEVAWAVRGEGAWLDGKRLQVSKTQYVESAHLSAGNLTSLARSPCWAKLGAVIARANRFRGYGDYYHYHRLAAGQLDAVIESDVNILDIAALTVLVREAGGVFTDLAGRPVGLDTRSVLAAPPALHAALLDELAWDGA
jgi:histidinol-phosphatase